MNDPRRNLPAVDTLLADPAVAALARSYPRPLVVRAVRETIDAARARGGAAPDDGWADAVRARAERIAAPSLEPAINATGVVLHTNLGRAVLAPAAIAALSRVASGYSTLEYDVGRGARGSRQAHSRGILMELTGAEDALVVNNAAGALLLALSALARGGEVIVSRGEMVEIGGAFRIPDIMTRSGATLIEVGTTNRTHTDDYAKAITLSTRALLKVHRSNFQVTGFTAEVSAAELARLARVGGAASLYDLGSGLLIDLADWGLTGEPTVADALGSGVDLIVFSGDKLLGGPQAGVLLGAHACIEACRTDPLARPLRADKFTLAALEATLALYRDRDVARREIPVLRMLTQTESEIRRQADALCAALPPAAAADVVSGYSEVGGGSFPGARLATWLVRLAPPAERIKPGVLAERLRAGTPPPPVIVRITDDHVALDPRTILPEEADVVVRAVTRALDG